MPMQVTWGIYFYVYFRFHTCVFRLIKISDVIMSRMQKSDTVLDIRTSCVASQVVRRTVEVFECGIILSFCHVVLLIYLS